MPDHSLLASPSRRVRAGALAASLLAHLALLGLLARVPESPPPPLSARPQRESSVTYLDLPPLTSPGMPPPLSASGHAPPPPVARRTSLPPATPRPGRGEEAAAAPPPTATSASAHPLLRQSLTDPRLLGGVPPAPLARPGGFGAPLPHIAARAAAAAHEERERRQVSVLGRRITLFGDSGAHHSGLHFSVVGRRVTMPEDGRDWQELEMRRQRDAFTRDSIIRARDGATRLRREPRRGSDAD